MSNSVSNSESQFVFEVVSHLGVPRSGKHWTLSSGEGKVGRGEDCDLSLPDESRIISRVHAIVRRQGDQCVWTDLGANPSVIDGRTLLPGEPCLLNGNEQIQVGDYQLTVTSMPSSSETLNGFGASWEAPSEQLPGLGLSMPLPDDLDFLHVPQRSMDDIFQGLGEDEPAMPSAEPSFELPPSHPLSEPLFLAHPVKKPMVNKPVTQQAATTNQTPLEKGLELPTGQHLSPEQEHLVGELLRACLDGVLQMLWSRKVFRNEMGASFTEILASKNNPLKFSMDVSEALERLVLKSHSAFMPPVEAVAAAVDDLLQHNASALSGLQEALNTALHSLDPEAVESSAVQERRLGVLPLGALRKARLWMLYCERYREIGRRPQDDPLNRLFSDSMRAAMRKPGSA